jgi:hypothetical protein
MVNTSASTVKIILTSLNINETVPKFNSKAAEDSFNIKLVMRLIIAPQITTRPIKFNNDYQ